MLLEFFVLCVVSCLYTRGDCMLLFAECADYAKLSAVHVKMSAEERKPGETPTAALCTHAQAFSFSDLGRASMSNQNNIFNITNMNSFQITLIPNPEKLYEYYSATKRTETCVRMCSLNAFKFRCRWLGNRSKHGKGQRLGEQGNQRRPSLPARYETTSTAELISEILILHPR